MSSSKNYASSLSSSHNFGRRSPDDDTGLNDWIEQRQKSFRDFEQSFFNHQQPHFKPLPPLRPIFSRPFSQGSVGDSSNQYDDDDGGVNDNFFRFRPPRAMLSERGEQSDDLSPKAKVTYDEDKFQVEFNVKDYRPDELSIKTEGDVLVVMGKHVVKSEVGGSYVSKQFEQKFSLPSGVKPESISSSLTSKGVLTVTAPREITGFRKSRGAIQEYTPRNDLHYTETNEEMQQPHPKVYYDDDKFQISIDCSKYKPEELDVKIEGNNIIITAKQEVVETGGKRTRVFEQKFSLPSGVKGERVTSAISKEGMLTITAPRGNTSASSVNQSIEQSMDRVMSPSTWNDDFTTRRTSSTLSSMTPPKSLFATDKSIFDDDLMVPAVRSASPSSMGKAKVQVDDDVYKILIDVKNFEPEELVIKTVGNTVHVEAKHEEKTSDGHSFSSRSFSQSYSLPRGIDPESVTSSLTKDGTLTIAAPLPTQKLQSGERLVPIKHS